MSDFQPYKYRATGVGTFQVEGPGLEGCAPVWDHEVDADRCVLSMNNAWRASRKHAVSYLEARSQHFRIDQLTERRCSFALRRPGAVPESGGCCSRKVGRIGDTTILAVTD